jgi:hypothetical protein
MTVVQNNLRMLERTMELHTVILLKRAMLAELPQMIMNGENV